MISNMDAVLLFRKRQVLNETAFVEMVIWRLPKPLRGSEHVFKYRLALISDGVCVLRYENEAGKGDHKHVGERQVAYRFTSMTTLQTDFWNEVEAWRAQQ
jgi:hypothetical protein